MKKNIYKILFAIVCMFMTIGLVAGYNGGNAGGQAGSSGGNVDPNSDVAAEGLGNLNYVIGIRLMFYTSSGQKIHAQDYVAQRHLNKTIYTQYGNGTPCGKIDNCSIGTWTASSNIKSINELTNALGVNVQSKLENKSLAKEELFSAFLNSQDVSQAKQMISRIFPYNVDDYYNSSIDAYDLFIVWEPLGLVYYRKEPRQYKVGTSRELVAEVKNMDASGAKYIYNGRDIGAWGGLGNAVTKNMGCAAFLEYELDFGRRVNQKFKSFTETSYFNGKLNLLNSFSSLACKDTDKNDLANLANNNSSDYAVGVLWFDDIGSGRNLSCSTIQYDVGNGNIKNGHNIIMNSINKNGYFNFELYNQKYRSEGYTFPTGAEGGITTEWYKTNCSSNETYDGYDCTPTYNVPSCTTGDNKTLVYKDSTDWERCIFTDVNDGKTNKYTIDPHKWSNKTQNLSYYDENLSSKYCEVYCVEEVYGNFDANNPTVLAGNHFVWGWSHVQTVRTCKTKSINTALFEQDLKKANEAVVQQLAQNQLKQVNEGGTWSFSSSSYAECTQYGKNEAGVPPESSNCPDTSLEHVKCEQAEAEGYHTCTYKYKTCDNYKYSKSTNSKSVTVAGITKTATYSNFTKCVTSKPEGNPVPAGNVEDAVANVNKIISEMNKCYEFDNKNVLNEQSKANISYVSSNGTYDYSGEMKKSIKTNYDEGTCPQTQNYTVLNNCSGTSCNNTTKGVKSCESHTEVGNSIVQFSLADDVYRFVIKNPNGLTLKSVVSSSLFNSNYKETTTSNYKNETVYKYNWTDIGYSNFPVPYNAENKEYSGSLKIDYVNLGHKKSNSSSTDVDTVLKSVSNKYGEYGNWACGYTVESRLIECGGKKPCAGDINVIYREIDLYDPFPDTNSKGRHTGANWCSIENCDYDEDNVVVKKYILENRNVIGDDIYDLEPMYTFIMTPSDIIKIRRYNEENTYSSYDGNLDGKNYSFICTTGSLRNCRSDYLSQLLTDLDATNLPGTCKNDRQVYQGDTASSRFEKCRY